MASVTPVWLDFPPMVSTTGTASPGVTPEESWTFTWSKCTGCMALERIVPLDMRGVGLGWLPPRSDLFPNFAFGQQKRGETGAEQAKRCWFRHPGNHVNRRIADRERRRNVAGRVS